MNYTKGEWKASIDKQFNIIRIVSDKVAVVVSKVGPHIMEYGTHPENLANAHLIAAAPDMYEALKNIVANWADMNFPETMRLSMDKALTVLAKAEGK